MRTFVLGVGAQKAGTTWLFKQLIKSAKYKRGFSKEYHLFDVLHLEGFEGAKNNIANRVNNYPFSEGERFLEKSEKLMLDFYADERKYFDYMDSILTDDESFTLDITPSYSGLSSEVLAEIKQEFKSRGIVVKVVFIMREPVTRIESAVRMELKRKKLLSQIDHSEMTGKIFTAMNSVGDRLRSDYMYTCQQIDKVFTPDEVFYGFYETLFSENEIARLSSFLEVEPNVFDSLSVVNSSAKPYRYSIEDVKALIAEADDRYQFVSDRFDFDLSIWEKAAFKLVETA